MSEREFRVAYNARDFDATVGFFETVLGLDGVNSWERPDGKGALFAAGGNAVVEVLAAAEGEAPFEAPPQGSFSLMVAVDDLEKRLAEIVDRGGVVAQPIVDKPWNRSFSVRDPNGVEIFFFTPKPAG